MTEQQHQKDWQRLRALRPIDDDFTRCLFKNNIPLAELVLRIITDKSDLMITDCETQKDMKRLVGARSVCLDAYGTDSVGKRYDLEIQKQEKGVDRKDKPCNREAFGRRGAYSLCKWRVPGRIQHRKTYA